MYKINYNQHDWNKGEVIKEENLDNMENGIKQATDKINEIIDEVNSSSNEELQDIRVGADGITYESAGESVREQFSNLDDKIEQLFEPNQTINIKDFSQNLNGVSCVVRDSVVTLNGKTTSNSNFYIPLTVNEGTYYYYCDSSAPTNTYFSFCDNTQKDVCNLTNINSLANKGSITTTGASSYLRIKADFGSGYNNVKFKLCFSENELNNFVPPVIMLNSKLQIPALNNIEIPTIYHVGIDKEYNSFIDCLKNLQDDETQKIIYVHQGTYDIFAELGGQSFINSLDTTKNWAELNVFIPINTKIVGIGNVVFNYLPTKEQVTQFSAGVISPINTRGNIEIENITINCQNCRYGIHDETSNISSFNEMTHKFKNVNINYLDGGVLGSPSGICFGCGFGDNELFEFENCKFEVKRTSGGAFYMHNWKSTGINGSIVNIKNSVFINVSDKASALQFGNLHTNNTITQNLISINNSYLFGTVNVIGDNINNTFDITLLNSGNPTINFASTLQNTYQPKIYGN